MPYNYMQTEADPDWDEQPKQERCSRCGAFMGAPNYKEQLRREGYPDDEYIVRQFFRECSRCKAMDVMWEIVFEAEGTL